MRQILEIPADKLRPADEAVLQSLGYQNQQQASRRVMTILTEAYRIYSEKAGPRGILSPVSIREFGEIFRGNGQNEQENPLEKIFPRAKHLALMAFTLGAEISSQINDLFKNQDYTLATLLDSIASAATDRASTYFENYFYDSHYTGRELSDAQRVLLYSPGYCGWHISGQQKIFSFLQPDELDLSLNENYLMSPLKSLTGVLIAGDTEIHFYTNDYNFCRRCKDQSCLNRTESLTSIKKKKTNGG